MDMEDEKHEGLTQDEIGEMEDKRIQSLNDAGINEYDTLHKCRQDLNIWNSYFNENIVQGKDDMNFVLRDQWTAIERGDFTRLFKPCMTANKLYDATKKIIGEQRKNKPDLLVRSLTGKATQEQINLRADLVRTISYQSQNDLVYQTAFKSALMMGFGAFQLKLDYESPYSFNQVIKFDLIPDATRLSFDPTAMKPHKGDGNFCSRNYVFSKAEFDATFPYILNPVSYSDPNTLLDFQWETRDTIIVCDYFVKEWFSTIIYKLSNGEVVTKEEWENMQDRHDMQRQLANDSLIAGNIIRNEIPKIVHERQTQDYKIMHYRLTQDKIIDFSEWPSKFLPIIFVDGDSYYVEGRQYTRSFVHWARDSQKFLNYVMSETAAEIKNRRREQWMATPDNIIGNEQMWRNPELQMGALMAKPDPKTGQMPTKQPPWDLSPALLTHFQRANQDIREILGFTEAPELQSKDISGIAKRERRMESGLSSFVFQDNLNQAIEQAGRVVLDLLPVIAGNDERHMVVNKKDGKSQSIIMNKMMPDGTMQNRLEKGDFDIEIDTGPSFAVQKELALEFFQQTIAANPQIFNLIADLWAKNLDIQWMQQISDRFQTLVPPEILAKENGQPPPPPQQNPQQQMAQMQQQMMMQEMQNRSHEIQIREQKQQLEKTKLMMDAHKLMADIEMSQSDNNLEKAKLLVEAKKIMSDIQMEHADHAHEVSKTVLDHHAKLAKIHADMNKKPMQNS